MATPIPAEMCLARWETRSQQSTSEQADRASMLLEDLATSAPFWTTLLSSVGALKPTGDWDMTIPQAGVQQV
eukprot:5660215-Amphidinium_carterae.1